MLFGCVQASLMSALSQVSSRALAAAQAQGSAFMSAAAVSVGGQGLSAGLSSSTAAGQVKLPALNRMVEVLLYNLPRIQVRCSCCRCPNFFQGVARWKLLLCGATCSAAKSLALLTVVG